MSEVFLLSPGKPSRRYKGNNAFGVLGVSPNASMRAIKRAYLELASQWHPDKNPSPGAREQFVKINQAYNFILRGGDLARYLALCDIVPSKQKYAESLRNIQRIKTLTGLDVRMPKIGEIRLPKEELDRQTKLVMALQFRCPRCKWKEGCDRVTGFGEVEDFYNRMVEESMRRVLGSL
jgi:hypothetical protein